MPTLAKQQDCTGCLACADVCSRNAIDITQRNGMPFPMVNQDKCVECKRCERTCPVVSPPLKNPVSEEKAYGAFLLDEGMRKLAASGGAFTGLAQTFLDVHKEGVVIGASLQQNKVYHVAIDNKADLALLVNSKYIQSHTEGLFKQVADYLKEGRSVLFSGLPCQVAAVRKFVEPRKYASLLTTVDLVCHGVASQEALDLHLEYYKAKSIKVFRTKEAVEKYGTSQCSVLDCPDGQKTVDRKNDVFYNIFASWLLDRISCGNCKFATLDRTADITIGDLWGHPDAHGKGVSLIMANNAKGNALVEQSSPYLTVWPISMREAFQSNANLWTGWKAIKWHPIVMFPDWFRRHLSAEKRLEILCRRNRVWNIIWAIFKVTTILHHKITRRKLLRKYKDFLK